MDTTTILLIGILAGFVCFCLVTAGYMVLMALNKVEDFDDVRIPETFELPKKLHEIETQERNLSDMQKMLFEKPEVTNI